jgi:hypothetical protein
MVIEDSEGAVGGEDVVDPVAAEPRIGGVLAVGAGVDRPHADLDQVERLLVALPDGRRSVECLVEFPAAVARDRRDLGELQRGEIRIGHHELALESRLEQGVPGLRHVGGRDHVGASEDGDDAHALGHEVGIVMEACSLVEADRPGDERPLALVERRRGRGHQHVGAGVPDCCSIKSAAALRTPPVRNSSTAMPYLSLSRRPSEPPRAVPR